MKGCVCLIPDLPTSVVFLMIHDKLLIAVWRRFFQVSDLSAFDGRVLAYHGMILEKEPGKRLPLLRKAAGAQITQS